MPVPATHQRRRGTVHRSTPAVDIVIPVHNEQADLETSVRRLDAYLCERFPVPWRITIADNASTDGTWATARRLAAGSERVSAIHLDQKGRGRALRASWSASDAPVVAYMDVDLSTDLDALLPLVAPLLSGHSDLAIGSRLALGAQVVRGPKRELISRCYNLLLKAALRNGFSDAQCGFKAVRTDVARALLPLVEDEGWFFDTEMLVLAERNGLRIHEVPVDWTDDPDSRVHIASTVAADLEGVWRLVRSFAIGRGRLPAEARVSGQADPGRGNLSSQLASFAVIGVVCTVLFALLFALLAGPLGPVPADLVALLACGVANTAANRRLTFAVRGRGGVARQYGAALAVAALPLVATVLTLWALGSAGVRALGVQLLVLTAVNAAATLGRFALLRSWVFAPVRRP